MSCVYLWLSVLGLYPVWFLNVTCCIDPNTSPKILSVLSVSMWVFSYCRSFKGIMTARSALQLLQILCLYLPPHLILSCHMIKQRLDIRHQYNVHISYHYISEMDQTKRSDKEMNHKGEVNCVFILSLVFWVYVKHIISWVSLTLGSRLSTIWSLDICAAPPKAKRWLLSAFIRLAVHCL